MSHYINILSAFNMKTIFYIHMQNEHVGGYFLCCMSKVKLWLHYS